MKYLLELIVRTAVVFMLALTIGRPTLEFYNDILSHHRGLLDQISATILVICACAIWVIISNLCMTAWSAAKRRWKSPPMTVGQTNLVS